MNTRNTIQRQLVLETVRSMYGHPDAEQIYRKIAKEHPHISKATVYRNLHHLAETGAIQRLEMREGADRYDLRTDAHHHMYCRICGRLYDAPDGAVRTLLAPPQGFCVEAIRLELVGVCADCQNKK